MDQVSQARLLVAICRGQYAVAEVGDVTLFACDGQHLPRLLRQHGMSVPDTVRHGASQVITESYLCVGYNYRMTDLQAAMGIEQMKRLDEILTRRRELAGRYSAALDRHPWIEPPYVPDYAEFNFQSYAVQLTAEAPLSRDALMQRLLEQKIATRRGIMLSHLEPAYAGQATASLRQSERASACSLLLPLYPQYSTTTTASSFAAWKLAVAKAGLDVPTKALCCYPTLRGLIDAQVSLIRKALAQAGSSARLLFSAHGLPERTVARGDPYPDQVAMTARAIDRPLSRPPPTAPRSTPVPASMQ